MKSTPQSFRPDWIKY